MKKEIIKPFDLEAYKNGAKVKTRDGHEARIICIDAKVYHFPIVALIETEDGAEHAECYTSEGRFYFKGELDALDLVIVEEVEEPEFWSDDEENTFNGFRINNVASISEVSNVPNTKLSYDVFATKKQAKSAKAKARISQIIANDIENFGGAITDEEWEDNYEYKFAIYRVHNNISVKCVRSDYQFLAFHTMTQRDLFLEKYRDLVMDFLMIG